MLIPASQLRFLRYLGCGAFGKVWEGRLLIQAESTGGEDRLERVALKVCVAFSGKKTFLTRNYRPHQ